VIDTQAIPGTRDELLKLISTHSKSIDNYLADGSTSWMPQLTVLIRDPAGGADAINLYALAVPFNTPQEKAGLLQQIGCELYASQKLPVVAVLSTEAWVAPDAGPGRAPADHPERREVICVHGSTIGGLHMAMRVLPIRRGGNNHIVPGEWGNVETEGVTTKLLNHVWVGFFADFIQQQAARSQE
jgi:hypothetical protein